MTGDLISRQATVERLCKVADFMNEKREGLGSPYIMAALFIQDNKNEFPSVTHAGKQESCEDAISRQAAIDTIENWLSCDDYNDAERHIMRAMQSVLYDLPPVTPTEKVGQWIKTTGENGVTSAVRCSECGFEDNRYMLFRYCPNCGAKMQEVKE